MVRRKPAELLIRTGIVTAPTTKRLGNTRQPAQSPCDCTKASPTKALPTVPSLSVTHVPGLYHFPSSPSMVED